LLAQLGQPRATGSAVLLGDQQELFGG